MKPNKNSKLMFIGGHATPAFAVLDELIERGYSNYVWVGEKHNQRGTKSESAEYRTVKNKYKIRFINLKSGKLVRSWSLKTFLSSFVELVLLARGFTHAFFIILRQRPKLIFSFGGFLAVPLVFWGKVFRSKVVTHEQTITVGLANKIISKFADRVFISFRETEKRLESKKVVFTGNPVRKEVFKVKSNFTRDLDKTKPILFITCGNQGAHRINLVIFEVIEELLKDFSIIHQTGNSTITGDYQKALEIKSNLPENLKQKYVVKDYIYSDEIGEAFAVADLLVSRAGANTVLEIMALGKLAVLIPIPWVSGNEQFLNARVVENTGLGMILEEKNLNQASLLSSLKIGKRIISSGVAFNNQTLVEAKNIASKNVQLEAAQRVTDKALELLRF